MVLQRLSFKVQYDIPNSFPAFSRVQTWERVEKIFTDRQIGLITTLLTTHISKRAVDWLISPHLEQKKFWEQSYLSCESARLPPTWPSTPYDCLTFGFFTLLQEIKSWLTVSPIWGAICPSLGEFHGGISVYSVFQEIQNLLFLFWYYDQEITETAVLATQV